MPQHCAGAEATFTTAQCPALTLKVLAVDSRRPVGGEVELRRRRRGIAAATWLLLLLLLLVRRLLPLMLPRHILLLFIWLLIAPLWLGLLLVLRL